MDKQKILFTEYPIRKLFDYFIIIHKESIIKMKIGIAGGGIAGLTAALVTRRAGLNPIVF